MRALGLTPAGCIAFWLAASLPAKELSEYQVGDIVEADIVAPERLIVIDAEGTDALKQKEAMKVPAFFFYHAEAADEVEQDFRAHFGMVRSNFHDAMEALYQRNRLNEQWLNSTRFRTLAATFKQQHPGFPRLTNLIPVWAMGVPDTEVQDTLVARLREAMSQRIRADASPPEIKLGSQVRLLTVTNREQALTLEMAEQQAALLFRTNLHTLSRVRSEFQQFEPLLQPGQAGFLATFLKPNCILNTALTTQSRTRRVDHLYAADRYEAGQLIAGRGEQVDDRIMVALKQLNTTPGPRPPPKTADQPKVASPQRQNPWPWAGLALVLAGLTVGAWRRVNRKKLVSILPARVAGAGDSAGIITCPSCAKAIVIPAEAVANLSANSTTWQARALAAERRAERAQAAIRAGLLPHLADWLKQRFVRGLVSERSQMLHAQKSAAAELVELERRLDALHAPLQERLHTYEQRIAELEKLLAAKGEENRVLLQAKIEMTRRQLETTRNRNPLELN